ncbi:acyl-CoA thioesterase [Synechococcus sp. CS-1325]|nr:acyl-CoA thioesterase [Synechococcus sp. CS-1325]MCT0214057.1 acyl-CoA thioesterase [Synechococcus sp. CS-1326]MCT0234144.1 acyl-CoA thioesterase [Synechococcus sp. CS-1327]PZV00047.1 MAG: acyl-CoA thioesterase [Cyanobium sp.]
MDQQPGRMGWCLRRRVLPQHTDHAGVMWHGAYLGWLEEARVEALAAAGLAYADLAARGLELPVVSLSINYRQALRHGDAVELWSVIEPRRGIRLRWCSRFLGPMGALAAEATVDLVLLDLGRGGSRRLVRTFPPDLEAALEQLLETQAASD